MIERLQIFKDSYTLTGKIYDAMPQMPKLHRYNLGARLIDCSLEVFKYISLVNKARGKDRVKMLDDFFVHYELLKVYLKICSDNKFFKLKTLVEMFKLVESISRQLSGWRAATTRALQ